MPYTDQYIRAIPVKDDEREGRFAKCKRLRYVPTGSFSFGDFEQDPDPDMGLTYLQSRYVSIKVNSYIRAI